MSASPSATSEKPSVRRFFSRTASTLGSSKRFDFLGYRELLGVFGSKLLAMMSLTMHLNKGFAYPMAITGLQYSLIELKTESSLQAILLASARMPFSMKPFVAIISDLFPILGLSKSYYILIGATLGSLGAALALIPGQSYVLTVAAFFITASAATGDILAEGFYSRKLAEFPDKGPITVSFVWVGQMVMQAVTKVLAPILIENLSGVISGVYGSQWAMFLAIIPNILLLAPAFCNWLGEPQVTAADSARIRRTVSLQPELMIIGLTLGTCALTNAAAGILSDVLDFQMLSLICAVSFAVICVGLSLLWFRPLIGNLILYTSIANCLLWTPSEPIMRFLISPEEEYPDGPHFSRYFVLTVLGLVGLAISAIFMGSFGVWGKTMRYRSIYATTTIAAGLVQAINSIFYARLNKKWGISDYVFCVGDTVIAEIVGALAWMPSFLILSRVCPRNVESTVFAIVASSANFSQDVGAIFGGFFAKWMGINPSGQLDESDQYANLWINNLITSGVSLIPLLFLFLIPTNRANEAILAESDQVSATVGSPYQRCTGRPDKATEAAKVEEAAIQVSQESSKNLEMTSV